MMFVTDLTAFAENGFYDKVEARFICICGKEFDISIAHEIDFHVKCDDCEVKAVVNSSQRISQNAVDRVVLLPAFVGKDFFFMEAYKKLQPTGGWESTLKDVQ